MQKNLDSESRSKHSICKSKAEPATDLKKEPKKATIVVKRQESSISTRLLCITYHTEGPLLSPLPKVAER